MEFQQLFEQLQSYLIYLKEEERSNLTIQQYKKAIKDCLSFLEKRELDKENILQYKETLKQKYQPTSVNAKLAALNGFFDYIGRQDLHTKFLKIQNKAYSPENKELSKAEYVRLIKAAEKKNDKRLAMVLQTICCTGIQVSELKFITVEAVERGEALVRLKGKTRTILIPGKLRKVLRDYLRKRKITSGSVFVTKSGKPLDRCNIWRMMKNLCKEANVSESKVFPHNLRHLFARAFYAIDKDIAKLADVLGHSNINTTRIYIMTTGKEHLRKMNALGLVCEL